MLKLNRENVKKLFDDGEFEISLNERADEYIWKIKEENIETLIDQILQLVPEGEVVAEGDVMAYPSGVEIGSKTLTEVNKEIFKYRGKKIQIIIREVK